MRPRSLFLKKSCEVFLFFFSCLIVISCSREPNIKNPNSLTIASLADAKRLLPMLASDSASASISGHIFRGLTKYNKNIVLEGDLAESWSISQDGLVITFKLRKDVLWHDGKPFTADDVIFTYNTVINPKVPTPYSSNYGPVKEVKKIDDYTVRVYYNEPFAPSLEAWGMGIIPKHVYEGKVLTTPEINRNPIGSGPYKIKEWVTGQKIVLDAFDKYYEKTPNIQKIITRVIPDTATMFLELKFGGIDYMSLTPAQFKLQAHSSHFDSYFNKFRYPSFSYTYLGFNLLSPLFKDTKVRQAISHAINKKDIITAVLLGYGTDCTGPFPPESWAYNPNVRIFSYNPQKAIELFKEAGWNINSKGILQKDGKPFEFTVITNQGNETRLKTAQIIKEQLKAVGINMNIKVLEWQAMLHDFIDKKKFEVVILGWSLSRDPDIYDIWHSSKTKEGEFNFVSYKNAEVDELLIKGRQVFSIDERKKIYDRIQEILAEEQPYIFLYIPDALPVIHKRFKGVTKAPIGIWHDYIHWYVPKNRLEWYN